MSHREYPWLERMTAVVLLLVLDALGWIVLLAWWPGWGLGVAPAVQVCAVIGLLVAALLLVSITALLHTRS